MKFIKSKKIKMKINLILIIFFAGTIGIVNAQHIEGIVVEIGKEGKEIPVVGANVFFPGTAIGTITDVTGMFHIDKPNENVSSIVVSYIGYINDTINASGTNNKSILKKSVTLNEVIVNGQKADSYISSMNPIKTEVLTSTELRKNACCNLAESFESNPTVDVSFTDAVTGAKKIQMLGLSGIYVQTMTDVLPTIRGLAINNGMNWIPGPWVESIQLNKGTGSVANGFESITGQINVELKKPETAERFFINLYGNTEERGEINLQFAHRFNKKLSTILLASGSQMQNSHDGNGDSFMDQPDFKQLQLMNRWKFLAGKKIEGMFGAKWGYDSRNGGQMPEHSHNGGVAYQTQMDVNRQEAFIKTSFNPNKVYQSIGLQLSGINHEQKGFFGFKNYSGNEQTLYANLIWQSIIGNTKHNYRLGGTFLADHTSEVFDTIYAGYKNNIPGAFFEYTYDDLKDFSAVLGLRTDYVNENISITPRLHIRYAVTKSATLRMSVGRGFRAVNLFAENPAIMATSRKIIFTEKLNLESAWNGGLNFTKCFYIKNREATFSLDLYRTQFVNQIVLDYDQSPQFINVSNLHGQSFANSFQAAFNFFLIEKLEIRLAYKYNDVQQTLNKKLMQKPLSPMHRALFNAAYALKNHWKFDATVQWVGKQRIPSTVSNPEQYQLQLNSPSYFRVLGQITYIKHRWEFYVGGENLNDFSQKDAIISADEPFGPYFDSSLVWGPLTGRTVYAGIRFTMK